MEFALILGGWAGFVYSSIRLFVSVCRVEPIVGCFFGNGDVVNVAFSNAGRGDAHKAPVFAQLVEGARATIAHTRAKTTYELIDKTRERSFVRHLSFNAFGHEFVGRFNFALEIAVFATALHCAQ